MSDPTSTRPQALITGASSGIGAVLAERLARDQYDLVPVVRRHDWLEALAQRLTQEHAISAEVLVADLTDTQALRAVEHRIAALEDLSLLTQINEGQRQLFERSRTDAEVARRGR